MYVVRIPDVIMKTNRLTFFLQLLFLLQAPALVLGEGTRELNPEGGTPVGWDGGNIAVLNTNNNNTGSSFASWGGPANTRLNIRVRAGEVIYLGFGGESHGDLEFRLLDNNGNVVIGPTDIDNIGAGNPGYVGGTNAANFQQIINGPQQLVGAGGYNALSYTVPATVAPFANTATNSVDYYIEFGRRSDTTATLSIELFDITVASAPSPTGVAIPGRLWSREWSLSTNSGSNSFDATMFVYTEGRDSVVTSVDFNGIRPFGFAVACNQTGPRDTGNVEADRQSIYKGPGLPGINPDYPIFLNDPDINEFPSGFIGCLQGISVDQCSQADYCINIDALSVGNVDVLLDLNGVEGYQENTADTLISSYPIVNDGVTCVPWNGIDGNGNLVPDGTNIPIQVIFFTGLTHLPMSDVENHPNGFEVNLVRPNATQCGTIPENAKIYWDDSQIAGTDTPQVQLAGCDPSPLGDGNGCHTWTGLGDNSNPEIINTWWYVNEQRDTVDFRVDTTTFDIIGNFNNAGGNCAVFNDGDLIEMEIRYSEAKYDSADLEYNLANIAPIGTSLDSVTLTNFGIVPGSTPTQHLMVLTYRIETPGDAPITDLQFDFTVNANAFCSTPITATRIFDCTLLPVSFTYLRAEDIGDDNVALHWRTASESNNRGFYVEKSRDGFSYRSLGFVYGAGDTQEPQSYDFLDDERIPGRWYYRLRQVDFDDTESYSKVITIDLGTESKLSEQSLKVYPNPVSNTLTIEGIYSDSPTEARLVNALGQTVWERSLRESRVKVQVAAFPKGLYFLQLHNGGALITKKVIVR